MAGVHGHRFSTFLLTFAKHKKKVQEKKNNKIQEAYDYNKESHSSN